MYYLLLRSTTGNCQSLGQSWNSWIFDSNFLGIEFEMSKFRVSGLIGLTGSGRSRAVLPERIPEAAACGGKPGRSVVGTLFFYLVVLIS